MRQWSIYERTFTTRIAYPHPYLGDDILAVTFTHPESGTRLVQEGFWDGENVWRVRFAPIHPGRWRWQTASPDSGLDGQSGQFTCSLPTSAAIDENPNYRGHVQVVPNGRYFRYADGIPFFFLGDTNWAVNTLRCGPGENADGPFYTWLRDRKGKGFTAVLVEYVEIDRPNEGGYPFPANTHRPGNGDYTELNPRYFQALDSRIRALWNAGFVVAGHPTWIGKRIGMPLGDAQRLSRYLLARYGAYNIIWSLSGEYQGSYDNTAFPWTTADWRALGETSQTWNAFRHPVSIHPFPGHRRENNPTFDWPSNAYQDSSGGEFHSEPWLDHNWLQTGQTSQRLWHVPLRVAENYARFPIKPVVHSEGLYENNRPDGATPAHIRWQAWAAYLNGAAGHGYGAGGIFQFYDPLASEGVDQFNSPPPDGETSWREALSYAGGVQLKHLAAFFSGIRWWELEPHREWLRIDGVGADVRSLTDPHCAASPNRLCVVYIPEGNGGRTIELSHLADRAWTARWFKPRDGASMPIHDGCSLSLEDPWVLPHRPDSGDWVLHLVANNEYQETANDAKP